MSYKLTYFDLPGRAEPIRMLFALAKVPFVDDRFKREDWARLKPTFKYGQVPVLYVDGKELAQSNTIMRFLGRKFKMTGADEWESARCDEFVDSMNDLSAEWQKFHFAADAAKKEEAKTALVSTHIPKYLGKFNELQPESGGNFLVGKNVTWADVHAACMLTKLEDTVGADVLDSYPNLKKVKNTVYTIPEIKAYLDSKK